MTDSLVAFSLALFPFLSRPREYRARSAFYRTLYQSIFTHVFMIPFYCGGLVGG